MRHLSAVLVMAVLVSGCSAALGGKSDQAARQGEVMAYLDQGRPKAALATADELVAQYPENYQHYLDRGAVYLVLREYSQAASDNLKALEVFGAGKDRYPAKERSYRLAKIHESMALTALVASRRTGDPAEKARLEKEYADNEAKVRELDEETWKNLRGLTGGAVE